MNQSVMVRNGVLIVNGVEIPFPRKGRTSHTITQNNGRLYVDWFEWKDGKWRLTLASIFNQIFW